MNATLTRHYYPDCVIGILLLINDPDVPFCCHTLEPPDNGDAPGASCVPEGVYQVSRYNSPTKGAVWRLTNPALGVYADPAAAAAATAGGYPARSEILIHVGNTVQDTEGCILLGMSYEAPMAMFRTRGVASSRAAFNAFMKYTAQFVDGWELKISRGYP